jgi:hypothetical protein
VIDDRIKLPLSQRWKEANSFRVALRDNKIEVEAIGPAPGRHPPTRMR